MYDMMFVKFDVLSDNVCRSLTCVKPLAMQLAASFWLIVSVNVAKDICRSI